MRHLHRSHCPLPLYRRRARCTSPAAAPPFSTRGPSKPGSRYTGSPGRGVGMNSPRCSRLRRTHAVLAAVVRPPALARPGVCSRADVRGYPLAGVQADTPAGIAGAASRHEGRLGDMQTAAFIHISPCAAALLSLDNDILFVVLLLLLSLLSIGLRPQVLAMGTLVLYFTC